MPAIFSSPSQSKSSADWLRRNILAPSSGTPVILTSPVNVQPLARRPSFRKLNERRNSFKKERATSQSTVATAQMYKIPGVGSAEDFLAQGNNYAMASGQSNVPLPSPNKVKSLAKRQVKHEYADMRAQREARRALRPRRKSVLQRVPSLHTIGEHATSLQHSKSDKTLTAIAERYESECRGCDPPVSGVDTQTWLDDMVISEPTTFYDSDSDEDVLELPVTQPNSRYAWIPQRPLPGAGALTSHPVDPEEIAKALYLAPAKRLARPGSPTIFELDATESYSSCCSDVSSDTIVAEEEDYTPKSAASFSSTCAEPSHSVPASPCAVPANSGSKLTCTTSTSEPVSRTSPQPSATLERATSEPIKVHVEPATPTEPTKNAHGLRHMDAIINAGNACVHRRRSSATKKDLAEDEDTSRHSMDSITSSNYDGEEADEVQLSFPESVGVSCRASRIGMAL